MPILNWTGKERIIDHHHNVPQKALMHQYGFTGKGEQKEPANSGNLIIHGDNLEALKALIPEYEGKIKCIYIDPPYNTGKENWVYNDNVNDPKIKNWLGQVVGKESEDLNRHDKWLCMMYPRLKLLHKLLSEEGVIFMSIDDHEYQNLKCISDEIFGRNNFITNFTWRTDGNFDNQAKIKVNHEYILCYSKNAGLFKLPKVIDPNISADSKLFNAHIRNTIVKNGPKNPVSEVILPAGFPCETGSGVIKASQIPWPRYNADIIIKDHRLVNKLIARSGWSSRAILEKFIQNDFNTVKDSKGQDTTFLISRSGAIENMKPRTEASHVVSSLFNLGSSRNTRSELRKMGIDFDYPKSLQLIEYLISLASGDDFIVLDSFAGSGTTAHAVWNLNKTDDRKRKFILIEMMDYAETVIAERLKKIITGYGETAGISESFDFYHIGPVIPVNFSEIDKKIKIMFQQSVMRD